MSHQNSYALLPVRNTVLYPGVTMPFLVKRPMGVTAVDRSRLRENLLIAVAQKDGGRDQPETADFYEYGTLARVERTFGSAAEGYQLVISGVSRFKIHEIARDGDGFSVRGEVAPDPWSEPNARTGLLASRVRALGKEILDLVSGNTAELRRLLEQVSDPGHLSFVAAANLSISVSRGQTILEEMAPERRLRMVLEEMERAKESLTIQREMEEKLADRVGKSQREALLREQMRTIQDELGEGEGNDLEDLRAKIEAAGMPEDVRKVASQELKRFERIGPQSPESHVIRTYLEWLCDMPWTKTTEDVIDLNRAKEILDEDHAGMDKIKRRILQHLAVMKLKKDLRGSILCLVGPPGVGKTSLGHSVARALGREFVRISLGGVRDESEIRGHRRTYIGAMPGRLVQGIKRAGTKNPVFVLDEIDKLGVSFQGDPAAALLEVLDPEQNSTFTDHYLDVPFDLSDVFFVATANNLEGIPAPLLDRLEVIQMAGYTATEKLSIAKRHLVPKQLKQHGLVPERVSFEDEALEKVISSYTREAGVRNLQREIGTLCRVAAERLVRQGGDESATARVSLDWLEDALGPEKFLPEVSEESSVPGVVTGLAWTPMGGEILFIESQTMPGKGSLTLTGQLGDVMKESAQIALSLVRAKLPQVAPQYEYEKRDIHIHVPSGAIPKDGPSAGIAILTSIASLLSGKVLDPKTAMTGEITLRGAVMPVGGVKEKVIAAHRAGIQRVILSKRNERDLREVPEEVRRDLRFEFVECVDDVLRIALGLETVGVGCVQEQQAYGRAVA